MADWSPAPEPRRARLLVVDDHPLARAGLRALLAMSPSLEVVGEAGNSVDTILLCEQLRPDLLITDLCMPGLDGGRLTAIIKGRFPELPVLILTVSDDRCRLDAARAAGADAVLSKDARFLEILQTVRRLSSATMPAGRRPPA